MRKCRPVRARLSEAHRFGYAYLGLGVVAALLARFTYRKARAGGTGRRVGRDPGMESGSRVRPRWVTSPVVWGLLLVLAALSAYGAVLAVVERDGRWVWDLVKGVLWTGFLAAVALDLRRRGRSGAGT